MHKLAKALGNAAYVVKEVAIDESQDCQVKIVARKPGFASWFLSLFGIDSTFTMRVFRDRLESEEGSLSGQLRTVVPLAALDTYTSGYTKPFFHLVAGAVIALLAIFGILAGGVDGGNLIELVLAAAFIASYYLKKCLLLDFTTVGANGIYFLFKRSVIENVQVDEKLAAYIAELVKRNCIAQTAK